MKSLRLSTCIWLGSLLTGVVLTGACSGDQSEIATKTGTLRFALTGHSSSGASYRLRDGRFRITGQATVNVSTEADPDAKSIDLELAAGNYAIALKSEWRLERIDEGGAVSSVRGALLSENPQHFTIADGQRTSVLFQFRVGDDVFELGNGGLSILLGIDDGSAGSGGVAATGGVGPGTGGSATGTAVFEVGPDMIVARMSHEVVRLGGARAVLLGGHGVDFVSLNTAEVWDLSTNTAVLKTMNSPRDYAAVQRLSDGTLLLAGGAYDLGVAPGYQTAEIFDPTALTFTAVGNLVRPRMLSSSTELGDGRVLIVGGWYSPESAAYGEIYNPATRTFTATGSLNVSRASPVVLPTDDGRAVVMGGSDMYGASYFSSVELYDPSSNSFAVLRSELIPTKPGWHVRSGSKINPRADAARLSDGRYVLVAFSVDQSVQKTALMAFDSVTLEIELLATIDGSAGPAMVDDSGTIVYLPWALSSQELRIARYDTSQASLTVLPVSGYSLPYSLAYPASVLIESGGRERIWVSGGTAADCWSTNFCAVSKTFSVYLE